MHSYCQSHRFRLESAGSQKETNPTYSLLVASSNSDDAVGSIISNDFCLCATTCMSDFASSKNSPALD